MNKRWKGFAGLLLAAVFLASFAGTCFAAEEDTSHYSDDRHLAYIGITLAAKTAANAVDLISEGDSNPGNYIRNFA